MTTEDLFSRKSDEYKLLHQDIIEPNKQRLSHIAMLLEKLVRVLLIKSILNFCCLGLSIAK